MRSLLFLGLLSLLLLTPALAEDTVPSGEPEASAPIAATAPALLAPTLPAFWWGHSETEIRALHPTLYAELTEEGPLAEGMTGFLMRGTYQGLPATIEYEFDAAGKLVVVALTLETSTAQRNALETAVSASWTPLQDITEPVSKEVDPSRNFPGWRWHVFTSAWLHESPAGLTIVCNWESESGAERAMSFQPLKPPTAPTAGGA